MGGGGTRGNGGRESERMCVCWGGWGDQEDLKRRIVTCTVVFVKI